MHRLTVCISFIALSLLGHDALATTATPSSALITVTLENALQQALHNNHLRPASRYAVAMAEAQHSQALASYWPQFNLSGGYKVLDEDPNFIFPSAKVALPQGGTINLTVPGVGTIATPGIEIPANEIILMDRELWQTSLNATWLLYDGGMRRGYSEQSLGYVDMMKEEARRTDLQLIDTVKRYYFGAVLASKLHHIGTETLERMEATLHITETFYHNGSGSVKKTDWLNNMVLVESIRSMQAQLEKNDLMARAALANSMGLSWQQSAQPVETELVVTPLNGKLVEMVSASYQFNPDWAMIEAALHTAEGALTTAKSGYYPQVALTGELYKWWNDTDTGMATQRNKEGWALGIGIQIPLFNGFLTKHKIAQTRARISQLKEQQLLLKEGIGLQLKDTFLSLRAAEKTWHAAERAMNAAKENRILTTRAYQYELIDTEKVIQAQLFEALTAAQYHKACYDHLILQSKIDTIIGKEWQNWIEGVPTWP